MCADMQQAMEDIIEIGCERILTSGGKSSAIEGSNMIAHLIEKAAERIVIMPGAGVNENTVADLIHYTNAKEIHSSSARSKVPKAKMEYQNDHILMGYGESDEFSFPALTGVEKVRNIIRLANG